MRNRVITPEEFAELDRYNRIMGMDRNYRNSLFYAPADQWQLAVDQAQLSGLSGAYTGGSSPLTFTVLPDDTVIISRNNRAPAVASIDTAETLFPKVINANRTGVANLPDWCSGAHAEGRGYYRAIQYAESQGISIRGAFQVSTHYSCPECTLLQMNSGIINLTGFSVDHGGMKTRPLSSNIPMYETRW